MEELKETIKFLEGSNFYYSLVIGMDNRYIYVSPHYGRNFGFATESLVGKPFYITLHPDDVKICREVGGRCFENPGQLLPATLRKHDGKGGFISTQWEFRAIFDKENQPNGIFCIGHNITEQVVVSNLLENAKAEIDDKTGKLTEIGLMQSHVVRKPLANILGLANLMINMEPEPEMTGLISMMINSATELDNAVKTIIARTDPS